MLTQTAAFFFADTVAGGVRVDIVRRTFVDEQGRNWGQASRSGFIIGKRRVKSHGASDAEVAAIKAALEAGQKCGRVDVVG